MFERESLNLPFKAPMNDRRAVIAMKLKNLAEVDDDNNWKEKLNSQVFHILIFVLNICDFLVSPTGKLFS